MGIRNRFFVDVKRGTKVTYSSSDLNKLDKTYENEVFLSKQNRIKTPFRKIYRRADLSRLRDYAFEKILDNHIYTFRHLLVVPNPYGFVRQSALILFNSSKETKIRYCVVGDTEEADFTGETEYTTRHRVPVMGLYFGRSNRVRLEMFDTDGRLVKRREIRIYVSDMPKKLATVFGETGDKKLPQFPFIMFAGPAFNPFAVDCNLQVRYMMGMRTNRMGMIPLTDGRFLYEDSSMNCVGEDNKIVSCCYHEMDYMGRVYQTYLLDFPILGIAAQQGDSLFLASDSGKGFAADCIVELERSSGRIKKRCRLSELLGNRHQEKPRWADISGIIAQGDKLIVAVKRLHTVFQMDWKRQELEWVLAPVAVWKGQEVSRFRLQGDIPVKDFCRKPDFISIAPGEGACGDLVVFGQMANGDIKLSGKPPESSVVGRLRIDPVSRTFQTLFHVPSDKIQKYGSAILSEDGKYVLAGSGSLKERKEGRRGCLSLIGTETGEKLFEIPFGRFFSRMWLFQPDIKQFTTRISEETDMVFGTLQPPAAFHGQLPPEDEERIERIYFGGVRLCGNILLYNILPGRIDRVYFIGEKFSYVQDYSGLKPANRKVSMATLLKDFEVDEYQVLVESRGVTHRLKNDIRVIGGKTEAKKEWREP